MAAELGAPVRWAHTSADATTGARMLIGPSSLNPALRSWRETSNRQPRNEPYVAIDHAQKLVAVDAPLIDQLADAIQLLRTAIWTGSELVTATYASSASGLLDRVDAEVRRTFPNLKTRVPDWGAHLRAARDAIAGEDDIATVQTLMARLHDAHSWAKDPRVKSRLPYHTMTGEHECRFWNVPTWSHAWQLGMRPGDRLLQPDASEWTGRIGSTPHAKPWLIGYRMLAGRVGEPRELAARRADGSVVAWTEPIPSTPWRNPVE